MKQLIQIKPIFTPGAPGVGTLDFASWPNFSIQKLYAVINVTRNTPLFVAGAPGLGVTLAGPHSKIFTLSVNTVSHAPGDLLNVYYDTAAGPEANTPAELGGQMQLMQESMDQILAELKVMNIILMQGLNISTIGIDDPSLLRNDVNNTQNYPTNY